MAVLLIGGTGKTAIRIVPFLQDAKIPFLLASRKGEDGAPPGLPATKFDWLDSSTFESPFQHKSLEGKSISAIYLIAPQVSDPTDAMTPFIDLAVEKYGVKRFVVMGGGSVEKGGTFVGKVWQHLDDLGVEYCVLRPTWFMENFTERQHFGTIKDEGKVYTACGDGKIPFIGATDIAAVAFHALTDETPPQTDYSIVGPELLTHDEIAAKLSSGLGRDIVNVKLTGDKSAERYVGLGMPEHYAKFLSFLEVGAAGGMEDNLNDTVERVTGRPPQKFDDWVQQNKRAWD
ncbi:MAG: hypothetical protein M1833_003952 [Piccolia ochrophora]|nr:MAG: hypothetical protein M1833_003952 [Piccolia ochrophora]